MHWTNGKIVTHCVAFPPINLHNPSNVYVRSRDKLKTYLSYHSAYGRKTYQGSSHTKNRMTLRRSGHVKSRDKFYTLYLHLQKTHGHQIKQGADLP